MKYKIFGFFHSDGRNIISIFNFKNSAGFTLLEILIAFAIIAVLSLIGIASFINFNRSQILNTATAEFVGTLNLAKSRTLSQVKPCTGNLKGYKVGICPGGCGGSSTYRYAVYVVCEGGPIPETLILGKNLPSSSFSISSLGGSSSFLFEVLTGHVTFTAGSPETVTITGFNGNSKQIIIYSDGRIVSN